MLGKIEAALKGTPDTSKDVLLFYFDRLHRNIEAAGKSRKRSVTFIFAAWIAAIAINSHLISASSIGGLVVKDINYLQPALAFSLAVAYYMYASATVAGFVLKDTCRKMYKELLPAFHENDLAGLSLDPSSFNVESDYINFPYNYARLRASARMTFRMLVFAAGAFAPVAMFFHVLGIAYFKEHVSLSVSIGTLLGGMVFLVRGFLLWNSIVLEKDTSILPLD